MNTLLLLAALAAPVIAADSPAAAPLPAADPAAEERAKVLYALGAQVAGDFVLKPGDVTTVAEGMADQAAGKALKTDVKEYGPKVAALKRAAADARRQIQLDAYAAEQGARRLPSGLIYRQIKAGAAGGAHPKATDMVKVHYHGTFPDGRVFDSSVERGEPMSFPLNGVIACWTEGVQLLVVGEKAKLVCPYEIAYGERGRPPAIPERATLLFDVELLGIGR